MKSNRTRKIRSRRRSDIWYKRHTFGSCIGDSAVSSRQTKCAKRNWQQCHENRLNIPVLLHWPVLFMKSLSRVWCAPMCVRRGKTPLIYFYALFSAPLNTRAKNEGNCSHLWPAVGVFISVFINLGRCAFYSFDIRVDDEVFRHSRLRQIIIIEPVNNNNNANNTVHVIYWNNTITFLLSIIIIMMAATEISKKRPKKD